MALQEKCLNEIIQNFEMFFVAYSTTNDANLKKNFEFLRRAYSEEIATQLLEKQEIEDKYADFLINKYVKSLNTRWFGKNSWERVVAIMTEIGENIKKVKFYGYCEQKPWHEIFCLLPNVEVLHFQDNCVDEALSSIAEFCPNIEEIELPFLAHITDEGFKSLCKERNGKIPCSKLKKIFLELCIPTKETAKCLLKNLPSLEVFQYIHLPHVMYLMHHQDALALDKVKTYKLTELDFSYASSEPHYADILKLCLSLCPNVITLTCHVFKREHLDAIAELSNVETLHLKFRHQDRLLGRNAFLKLKGSKLTSLTVSRSSASVFASAESCGHMKLNLINANGRQDEENAKIPFFDNLLALTVVGLDVERDLKRVCLIISSSRRLGELTLKRCDLNLSNIRTVILNCCRIKYITEMDFTWANVDREFILEMLDTCCVRSGLEKYSTLEIEEGME